jgi:ribonuclease BN (tRNA processing enzyme)
MARVRIRVLGCGDAFGSGGRLQTCFAVTAGAERFLIDCGATALVGMRRFGVDPGEIDAILLSHLHGDHFGGLPFLLLHEHHAAGRTRPLTIAGPEGLAARIEALLAASFPGAEQAQWRFPLELIELRPGASVAVRSLRVEAHQVMHPSGSPSLGLRVKANGRTVAYSGDSAWTDALLPLAQEADLFICECYAFEQPVSFHLSYQELRSRRAALTAKRIVLTHMSQEMLARLDEVELETADDGQLIEV